MADFKKQVIGTAIGLLIFAILVIGLLLYSGSSKDEWPPIISDCPDYWIDKVDSNGDSKKCFNVHNLGKSSCETTMDFSKNPWSGSVGDCRKYKWAKSCKLTWDGITNNSSICDNSDSDSDSDSD